jgi:hypothetical protein
MSQRIIAYAALRHCPKNMLREADRLEQASVDPLLDPTELFPWVVDRSQLGGRLFLEWPRPSKGLEGGIARFRLNRESNQRLFWNFEYVGQPVYAQDL